MNHAYLLIITVFCLVTPNSALSDDSTVRDMARKDYQASLAKIQADEFASIDACARTTGPAANACMIQAHGKRVRAEMEAKEKMDRASQTAPLPDAQVKTASDMAAKAAKEKKRSTGKSLDAETKAAETECNKLIGPKRKACMKEMTARHREAVDWADAAYKKARSDAKGIKGR